VVRLAEQFHVAPSSREIHVGAQHAGTRRAEGELLATGADLRADQCHLRNAPLAAEHAVLADDHETAVVLEACGPQHRIIHRCAGASFDRVVVQLDDSGTHRRYRRGMVCAREW
jgi:hypothetical protein